VGHLASFVTEVADGAFPPVVCGDFNASPDSDEIRRLTGRSTTVLPGFVLADAWETAGHGGLGHTLTPANPWAAPLLQPDRRIDYVFVGPPRKGGAGHVIHCTVVGDQPVNGVLASDHYAVLADLRY
jgi:endonuclease/exonuclease/phosphatase family metal-dependent hydrolase